MIRSIMAWLTMLTAALLLALAAGVVLLPRLLYPPLSTAELQQVTSAKERIELQQAQGALRNDARTPLLQGLGGILIAVGLIATWQQIRISREGQITDRFTHAIDQLGSNKPEVRIGGIRALERIATNSKEDRATIAYVLGAFVRIRAARPAPSPQTSTQENPVDEEHLPWLQQRAPDVQTALWVLGRRKPAREPVALYLSRVDLRSAHLAEANLSDTQLRHANLAGAWMPNVDLSRSDLELADLHHANLQGARLCEANLQGTNLRGARFEGTDLTNALADDRTVWPEGFDASRLRNAGVLLIDTSAAVGTPPKRDSGPPDQGHPD